MDVAELVVLDSIPALRPTQSHLRHVHAILDQLQIFKRQCSDVLEECAALLIAVHRETGDIQDVSSLAERLDKTVSQWTVLTPLECLLRRNDMAQEILRLHELIREFNAVNLKHNLPPLRSDVMLERDEIRDLLRVIVSNTHEMQSLLSVGSQEALYEFMKTLQMELYDPQLTEPISGSFTKALWFLHKQTSKLPPLTDLTGQVIFEAVDQNMPILGRNLVYSGQWLGAERVSPETRKSFECKVEQWRHLRHENIVSPYGIVHYGPNLFMVQPWVNNGTALDFVQHSPDDERLKIINGIAAGLEYLHAENIIHGDLRGANVFIDVNGSPVLSGFGIASFAEDYSNEMTSSDTVNPRWSAPELLRSGGSMSTQSDVWSFGMTALELMTGQPPFSNIPREIAVLRELDHGKLPDRPQGLSDDLWAFMRKCWHKKPASRPSAASVNNKLRELRELPISSHKSPKKRLFSFSRPSTVDGTSSHPFSGHFSIPSRRTTSPLPPESHPHSTMETLGHARALSAGAVSYPESRNASRSLSFHSDRSESQVEIGPHLQSKVYLLSDDRSTPTLSPDTDSDLQSVTSGSSYFSLPDSLMVVDDPATGDVYAGTVEGLVDKLLSRDTLKPSEFEEVILATCSDFTTPETLLSIIIRRFYDSQALQSSVFAVLTFWLSSGSLHVPPLSQIKEFCLTVIAKTSSAVDQDARHIFRLAEQRTKLIDTPPVSPLSTMTTKILRTSDILPRDLAIALTLLEGDSYWSILPADYLRHLRKAEAHSDVDIASSQNNKLVLWVKKSILTPSRVETRAEVLKFFVNTAHECQKFRNFASLSAIANALQSSPIERLTLTVGALSSHHRDMLQDLKVLLDPSNNHLTYRAALKPEVALDSQYRDFCIPWLAVHLRDLHSLLQNYPPTVEVQGRTLINFRRYSKFMEHVRGLRLLKPPDLEHYRQTGQLAYLQHQLRGVHFDADTDVALMQRSVALEADETRIHRTRALELKRLGFRS
ncbi:ras guanine nucleotide exchange factor domain-containing protein [Mycena olivaceomarginata]|nr:ras guanine nucleotide exchange factor domain-containing protein [Mycena olivaceomarginata]